jgi:3-methyladenine DNA glycosylase AlkD
MTSTPDILDRLKAEARPENLEEMAKFGMRVEKRLGVPVPVMRRIAKETGKDHKLAVSLWKTGVAEARIVASIIAVPEEMTENEIDSWVDDIASWDVCDQVCMNLFEKTPIARRKIGEWSQRQEEFVRRTAFALIACLAWHDKAAADQVFIDFLPLIERGATDERNFVKKAVSWALRNIGKRNPRLNKAAIQTAREIQRLDSKAAHWIASDAIRELEGEAARKRIRG